MIIVKKIYEIPSYGSFHDKYMITFCGTDKKIFIDVPIAALLSVSKDLINKFYSLLNKITFDKSIISLKELFYCIDEIYVQCYGKKILEYDKITIHEELNEIINDTNKPNSSTSLQ